MAVTHGEADTTWSDFRLEDGYRDDEIGLDLSALGPFTFPGRQYRDDVLEPVGMLEALAAADRTAELVYHQNRALRRLWQRFRNH